jgi:hypothetical protein
MKKYKLLPILLGLFLTATVFASPMSTDPVTERMLAKVRAATAKYQDVNVALADGYVPSGPCVAVPGLGVMGIHYVNFPLVLDPTVDELTPEILLYVETEARPRLVAVEYFAESTGQPAPVLFNGVEMHGPMPGHGPGEPDHFDLHVWLWQGNPDGIFEEFNQYLEC